ncbi:MAG: hypothetical protein WCG02_01025 [Candidatus Taylorbacteria bacterium]
MENSKTKSKIIMVSLLALVVIVIAGFVYYSSHLNGARSSAKFTSDSTVTGEWSTYTNNVFGYKFDYPARSHWPEPVTDNLVVMSMSQSNENVAVQFSVSVAYNISECYVNDIHGTSTQIVTISGNRFHLGIEGDQGMGQAGKDYNYAIIHNNLCYQLVLGLEWGREEDGSYTKKFDELKIRNEFQQILSTFKFISP